MEWFLGIGGTTFLIICFLSLSRNKKLNSKKDISELFNQFKNELTIIQNVSVPVQGGMGQIDFVVVSSSEVFVTSVIKAQGKIKVNINSKEWQAGKETIYNPLWRNRLLVNSLETILKDIRLIPLIIFTNGKLIDDFDANLIEFKNLKSFFKKRKKIVDPANTGSVLETLWELKKLGRKLSPD